MRVTSSNAYDTTVGTLQSRQSALSDAQQRLTSGKRVAKASDDPTSAARAERALASEQRSTASQRALEASRNSMTLTESALSDANDLLQEAREAMVSAGNASYSDTERTGVAEKLQSIRTQLLSVANRSDGAGGYLFGGQGANQAPFVDTTSGVQYRGITGQMTVASEEPLPLTVDGNNSWLSARTGNGVFATAAGSPNSGGAWVDGGRVTDPSALTGDSYEVTFDASATPTTYTVSIGGVPTAQQGVAFQSGKAIEVDGMSFTISGEPKTGDTFTATPSTPSLNVFDALDKTIQELKTPQRTGAQIQQTTQSGLQNIDASLGSLQSLRSAVGETLSRTDSVESRIADLKLYAQTDRTNAQDLDMVQAISDFSSQQSGYDAALKAYSMVQKLSLFQYISA